MNKFNLEDFNESKAMNAILYILQNLKRKDLHKIFKILYFSDRDHISEYGRSITGDTYIAMVDGPVPSKIYDILKSVRGDGYFKDKGEFSKFFEIEQWDLVTPKQQPNLKSLSKTDIEVLQNSLNQYGDLTWDEVREKSHDYAWRNTALNNPISIENLIYETGNSEEYKEYIKENLSLKSIF